MAKISLTQYLSEEDDVNFGTSGNDIIYANGGNDTVSGGDGNDTIYGGIGDDILNGNAGNDSLFGGDDNDVLNGGTGANILVGGYGADKFILADYLTAPATTNTISDFLHGTDLLQVKTPVIGQTGALNADYFKLGTTAADANDFFIYDRPTGNLYFDADGSGVGAKVLIATLLGQPDLQASDIITV